MTSNVSSKSKGLGKGISALIADDDDYDDNESVTQANNGGLLELETDTLVSGKYQPRRHFSQQMLEELAESIRRNGIMQPIVVRQLNGDAYEIIAGERRWRAAKLAGLATVPVVIRTLEDRQALELALIENIQREDLTPLEESAGYQRLMDEFAYTQEELAGIVGKSRSHIANLLRLLALPEAIKSMLDDGRLTMGHARALLGVTDAQELAEEMVRRGLNVRQAEQLVKRGNIADISPGGKTGARKPRHDTAAAPSNEDIAILEEALTRNVGLPVRILDNGQHGEIVIAYNDLKELDDVLRKLGGI